MWWALGLTGLAAGGVGALVGAGGGFLAVPALVLLFRLPPAAAAGAGLLMAALGAATATWANARAGRVCWRAGALFAAASYPGALAGVLVARFISPAAFRAGFGVLLLGLAGLLLAGRLRAPGGRPGARRGAPARGRRPAALAASLGTGFVSALFGIGGGPVQVPALMYLVGLPPAPAVATSQFILLCTAAVGALAYLRAGAVPPGAAALAGGAAVGAYLGARLGARLPARAMVALLAALLLVTGLRLLAGP